MSRRANGTRNGFAVRARYHAEDATDRQPAAAALMVQFADTEPTPSRRGLRTGRSAGQ